MTLRPTLKSKRTRTIVLFFLLFLLLPFSFQCVKTPLDFKAPAWSVPLNIQLIDRTFTFGQMIAKDPKFITVTDSTASHIEYRPSSIVPAPTAIPLPPLSPYQSSMTKPLGALQLDVPAILPMELKPSDFTPPLPLGVLLPGPDQTIPVSRNIPDPPANNPIYDYFVFKNGQMSLTIKNSFPFAIRFLDSVQLKNADLGQATVASFGFTTNINPGDSVTKTKDVSGKKMSANLNMSFSVRTVNVAGTTLDSTSKISAQLSIVPLPPATKVTMSSAQVAFVNDQPVDSIPKAAVQIVDDTTGTPTKIKRAEFLDGAFRIIITNNIATRISAFFKLPEFVKLDNTPFELAGAINGTVLIPARSSINQLVELKNYKIQSQDIVGNDTLSVRDVNYSLSIKALKQTVGKVLITDTDYVTVDIVPQKRPGGDSTYILKSVTGKVKPTQFPIKDTVEAPLGDIGNKFSADAINFDKVSITLKILSTGAFPTDLAMKIYGLDKNEKVQDSLTAWDVGSLSDTLRLNPRDTLNIVFDKLHKPPVGHGIDEFLSSFFSAGSGSLPQKFIVKGRALVDPLSVYQIPTSTGTVKVGDSVYTSVEFKFPVRVGIINGTYKDTISISDTSGNKIDKKSLAQIDNGKVIFTINNAFPFQLDVNSWLLQGLATDKSKPDPDTAHVLLWLPKKVLTKDSVITADSARYETKKDAPVGVTGTVISLTPDDVLQFNPASFIAVAIKMNTAGSGDPTNPANGKPVEFKNDYFVRLKAFMSVRFNVNFDKLK